MKNDFLSAKRLLVEVQQGRWGSLTVFDLINAATSPDQDVLVGVGVVVGGEVVLVDVVLGGLAHDERGGENVVVGRCGGLEMRLMLDNCERPFEWGDLGTEIDMMPRQRWEEGINIEQISSGLFVCSPELLPSMRMKQSYACLLHSSTCNVHVRDPHARQTCIACSTPA